MKDFRYYEHCFSSLHTAMKLGKPAPHKALLLLSVIDLVESGVIVDNHIELSDILIKTFNANAKKFYANSPIFKPEVTKPFYHMQHESFWRLMDSCSYSATSMAAEQVAEYGKRRPSYSVKKMREQYRYAEIDTELFKLLKNEDARARLRVLLISTYLNNRIDIFIPIETLPIYLSILSALAC